MKGLLLKEWYVVRSEYKVYFFMLVAFTIIAIAKGSGDFIYYPMAFCAAIPTGLMGYDEKNRWEQYCGTLPYTKKQLVSEKYLIGLAIQLVFLTVAGTTYVANAIIEDNFILGEFGAYMLVMFSVSMFSTSIPLPFLFKMGAGKGIKFYIASIVLVMVAVGTLESALMNGSIKIGITTNLLALILAAAMVGLYILSWYLSIVFYKKREL